MYVGAGLGGGGVEVRVGEVWEEWGWRWEGWEGEQWEWGGVVREGRGWEGKGDGSGSELQCCHQRGLSAIVPPPMMTKRSSAAARVV